MNFRGNIFVLDSIYIYIYIENMVTIFLSHAYEIAGQLGENWRTVRESFRFRKRMEGEKRIGPASDLRIPDYRSAAFKLRFSLEIRRVPPLSCHVPGYLLRVHLYLHNKERERERDEGEKGADV